MYGGYDCGIGTGVGGTFPRRSLYAPMVESRFSYLQQQQQNWEHQQVPDADRGYTVAPQYQRQIPQRQSAASGGGSVSHLEGLLDELRELVAKKGHMSPYTISMINHASEVVAAQVRNGGFQSPYHQQHAKSSIEAIRLAVEQRLAERERQQQVMYHEQQRDYRPVPGIIQESPAPLMSLRSSMGTNYEQPMGPMFSPPMQLVQEPLDYNTFSYSGGTRGGRGRNEDKRRSFSANGRGLLNDRARGIRGRGGGNNRGHGGGGGGYGRNKRSSSYKKQDEVARKKPLFSSERGKDRSGGRRGGQRYYCQSFNL